MLKNSRPQDLKSFIFSVCPVPGEGEGEGDTLGNWSGWQSKLHGMMMLQAGSCFIRTAWKETVRGWDRDRTAGWLL